MQFIAYLPEPAEVIARAVENAILEAGYRAGQGEDGCRAAVLEVEPLAGACCVRFVGSGVPLDTLLTSRPEVYIHWCERGSVYESYREGKIVESLSRVYEGEPECYYTLTERLSPEDGPIRLKERFPTPLVRASWRLSERARRYCRPPDPPFSWTEVARWVLSKLLS